MEPVVFIHKVFAVGVDVSFKVDIKSKLHCKVVLELDLWV